MENIPKLPLAYVILKTPARSGTVIDREHYIIKNAPLQVNIFYSDTKKVFEILK